MGLDDDTAFLEWAAALLELSPALRQVRFRLVPARMREHTFWSRYFAGLRRVIRMELFAEAPEPAPENDAEQVPVRATEPQADSISTSMGDSL